MRRKNGPLRVLVCKKCWLAQTEDYAGAEELFAADYAYFSSLSSTWLAHAERYVADMTARFNLDSSSRVIEVAANDGYLLQYVRARGIPCLGIEPTASTASVARARGIDIVEDFFGVRLAEKLVCEDQSADLMVANNVLAHVPDINNFLAGFARLLKPTGVATFEFPHLMKLVQENQFDTIYHEHFSYLSLTVALNIFEHNGLMVFDVDELPTHGGSLRLFAQRKDSGAWSATPQVVAMLARENIEQMTTDGYYSAFQARADRAKNDFLLFLVEAKRAGKRIAAYGAAAKGNTLLNYAGVHQDLLPWVADRNPTKQGKYLPGSRISIVTEERIREERPDYVVILPWNLRAEVVAQLRYIREWGGQFVTAIPSLSFYRARQVKIAVTGAAGS